MRTPLEWLNALTSDRILYRLDDGARLHSLVDGLRTSMRGTREVMEHADWWRFKPEYDILNQYLRELHGAMCDAEDLIGGLMYDLLRFKVESDFGDSTSEEIERKACKYFGDLLKRNANQISEAKEMIDAKTKQVREFLSLEKLDDRKKEEKPLIPITTSLRSEPYVFGREGEVKKIVDIVLANDRGEQGLVTSDEPEPSTRKRKTRAGGARVLPIVGIGGVGKTTVAREVYNRPEVKKQFDKLAWVCISNRFDKIALTRSILVKFEEEVLQHQTDDLDYLQTKLTKVVEANRTLLIFDDLWNDSSFEWRDFYAPFMHAKEGSAIIVTTRLPLVVARMTSGNILKPFYLEGLPKEDLWDLFKVCAFGSEIVTGHEVLQNIGKEILPKLCGSPLAAQTVGRLLSANLDMRHWQNVRDSELCQLKKDNERDILPSLRLSYQYLPSHLKRCFSFCATFEKDFSLSRDKLIYTWIAHGLVECTSSKRVEEVAADYLQDLTERFFLSKDPSPIKNECYTMHDLMHDVAKLVSFDESLVVKCSEELRRVPRSVRHVRLDLEDIEDPINLEFANCKQLRSLHMLDLSWDENREVSIFFNGLEGLTNLRLLWMPHFTVGEEQGRTIAKLKDMKNLSGSLNIHGLEYVRSTVRAREAKLDKKDLLDELALTWGCRGRNEDKELHPEHAESLEGLRPHPNLKVLTICGYNSDGLSPSWLKAQWLCNLTELRLQCCLYLSKPPLLCGRFELLTSLGFFQCENLASLAELSPNNLPRLESLTIIQCDRLEELPADGFSGFSLLKGMGIYSCSRISSLQVRNLQRLHYLHFTNLEALEELILDNLQAPHLVFEDFRELKQLRLTCVGSDKLDLEEIKPADILYIEGCQKLKYVGPPHALDEIPNVLIRENQMLTEINQPLIRGDPYR